MGNIPSSPVVTEKNRQEKVVDPIMANRSPEPKYGSLRGGGGGGGMAATSSYADAMEQSGVDDDAIEQMLGSDFAGSGRSGVDRAGAMGEQSLGFTALSQVKRMARREHSRRRADNLESPQYLARVVMSVRKQSGAEIIAGAADEDTSLLSKRSCESVEEEPQASLYEVLIEIIFGKVVSIFLLCIPFAFMAKYLGWGDIAVFWLNFFVMIPLAAILGDFTEELALHTNQVIGGLINASFGNAVEVVVAIEALYANEIRVVQASMIGSIFSNLLLVLGCCFFFGGLKYKEQSFNATAATANMSLLALSSIALVLPTPFSDYYDIDDDRVLIISRIAAIFLLAMYIQLLIFQLRTHSHLFSDDDDEKPSISMTASVLGLTTTTLLITVFSDMLVSSIDGFVATSGISRTFVGLIILPIVGNAVEHITAITVAMKNKMDLSMGIAVGSCTQIALFVVPLAVLVGWAMDRHMTLNFPHFEIILFTLSVIIVSICVSNPKTNWLEGSLLITTYFMVAVGFFYEVVEDF